MLPDCGYNPDYKIILMVLKKSNYSGHVTLYRVLLKPGEYQDHKYIIPNGIKLVILTDNKTP